MHGFRAGKSSMFASYRHKFSRTNRACLLLPASWPSLFALCIEHTGTWNIWSRNGSWLAGGVCWVREPTDQHRPLFLGGNYAHIAKMLMPICVTAGWLSEVGWPNNTNAMSRGSLRVLGIPREFRNFKIIRKLGGTHSFSESDRRWMIGSMRCAAICICIPINLYLYSEQSVFVSWAICICVPSNLYLYSEQFVFVFQAICICIPSKVGWMIG